MELNILVCVKRVPDVGGRINLSSDAKEVLLKNLGFTISPHEECAVEQAVQMIEKSGGKSTVLTLGPKESERQLRDCMAKGIQEAILLESDDTHWNAQQTSSAIYQKILQLEEESGPFDLILFGAESADQGNSQVSILVAHKLQRPFVVGANEVDYINDTLEVGRSIDEGQEIYQMKFPAVISVKDGLNRPRYPTLRGTLTAKKKSIVNEFVVTPDTLGSQFIHYIPTKQENKETVILGKGASTAPKIVALLKEMEILT